MRPAVYASVVRNRKQNARRIRLRAPQFSLRRVMVMVFVGGVLFIPGLILTILGVENEENMDKESPEQKVMYTVIGPAGCALGVIVLVAAVLYYFCYGFSTITQPRHSTVSGGGSHHGHSAYSSVKSSHGHSEDKSNGEARNHSRPSNKRSNSSSSNQSHHHHQSPHIQKTHHKRPASASPHTPPEEDDRATRLADHQDVTVTLETTPIPSPESVPEVDIVQHHDPEK
ncbi:uncharacterized protein LOC110446025 [Mizuhopecten yessoensis]|uniref:uncharacterized protein LOC110446025 n=1 Tax=Mizuhopecten yessoensis TaxID=6573 RepID=UPI000B45BA71|nr:uncharacterized protein LOC110446025 [Mizuhopecten yessoensis]